MGELYRRAIKSCTPAFLIFIMVYTNGCRQERTLSYQFDSEALRLETTELRGFIYDISTRSLNCSDLDPLGRRSGDAETRSEEVADHSFRSALGNLDVEIPALDVKRQLIVLEAWKNQLVEGKAQSTLLSFACRVFDFTEERTAYLLTLDSLQPLGSSIKVRLNSEEYPEDSPLVLADGVLSRSSFDIQLLDGIKQDVRNHPVHFRIKSGSAFFDDGKTDKTILTAENGVAETYIRAGRSASSSNGGMIEVEASAPGFQGGPIIFYAKVLPSFQIETIQISIDPKKHDLSDSLTTLPYYPNYQPFISIDLDQNGFTDFVTASGHDEHKIHFIYRYPNNEIEIYETPLQPGVATSIITAQVQTTGPPSIIVASNARSSRNPVAHLMTWQNSGLSPNMPNFEWTVTSTRMDWGAIALTSYDLNKDGTDEIGMVRCASPFAGAQCRGGTLADPQNEIAIIESNDGGQFSTTHRLKIEKQGGFRKVLFADLNQDGSPDVVGSMADSIGGFCGDQSRPNFGFTEPFRQGSSIGQVTPIAIGDFNGDQYPDLALVGAYREDQPNSYLRYLPGCQACRSPLGVTSCGLGVGPVGVPLGTRSLWGYQQELYVLDLNADGADDALNLHRTEGKLYSYLGGVGDDFGVGPDMRLPLTRASEMTLYEENGYQHLAMFDPDEHALVIVRIEPYQSTQ